VTCGPLEGVFVCILESCTWEKKEERGTLLAQCWIFSSVLVYCLGIVLAIYIKKVLLGFLPHEGFPG
jgi:hypothetical protein